MPIGAMIARYVKVFESADPAWFYLHVACQFSAYVIGVAGWGLGLKLGSESAGITFHKHRDIAVALFSLATVQVPSLRRFIISSGMKQIFYCLTSQISRCLRCS